MSLKTYFGDYNTVVKSNSRGEELEIELIEDGSLFVEAYVGPGHRVEFTFTVDELDELRDMLERGYDEA